MFVEVAKTTDFPIGRARVCVIGDRQIALYHTAKGFFASDNTCPHRGGPLGEGEVEGTVVTCPWHNWQYDVRTGESVTDDLKVDTYQVKVEGGDVLVAV